MTQNARHRRARIAQGSAAAVTVLGGSLAVGGAPVSGANIVVNTLDDSGPGSLRAAVAEANGSPGADEITFDPNLNGTITLTTGELRISDHLMMTGPGAATISVSTTTGNLLYLYGGADLTVSGLTLTGGPANGIRSNAGGDLAIVSSEVTGFLAEGVSIDSPGTDLEIRQSVITGNTQDGVDVDTGLGMTVTIADSTFDENGDTGFYSDQGRFASIDIDDSTFSGNTGVGLYVWGAAGPIDISGSTFENNGDLGIRLDDSVDGSVSISTSRVAANGDAGAEIRSAGSLTVTDVTVTGNTIVGLYATNGIDGDVSITGSTITDNGSHGLYVDGVLGDVIVSDSRFDDNGNKGLYLGGVGGSVTISDIRAERNQASGMSVDNVVGRTTITDVVANGNDYAGIDIHNQGGPTEIRRAVTSENDLEGLDVRDNAGDVTVIDTVVSSSIDKGLQVRRTAGDVRLDRVTVHGNANQALTAYDNTGDFVIESSTITANTTGPGVAVLSTDASPLEIRHSTISGNGGPTGTAVFDVTDAAVTLDHVVATGNADLPQSVLAGTGSLSSSYSLVPVGEGGVTDVESDTPNLGPLADNGGLTRTMRPQTGSPAIDAGDPAVTGAPATDQRGTARIVGTIDIGAVEIDPGTVAVVASSVSEDAGFVDVDVTRTGAAESALSVTATATTATATVGDDFEATTTTLDWADGDTATKTLRVPLLDDDDDEGDETFVVSLSSPTVASAALQNASVTILDAGAAITPLAPARFVDTRSVGQTIDGSFEADGVRLAGSRYVVQISGRGEVPTGARAVVMNITAVGPAATGFATVHPCLPMRPNSSSLNFTAGVNLGNEIVAPLAADGTVCIYVDQPVDLTADVVGYIAADSPTTPTDPARFLDTRPTGETFDGEGEAIGRRTAGSELELQVGGRGEIPLDAAAVIVNITAVGAAERGFVTVHSCVDPRPNASSLNYVGGVNRGNELVATLDGDGRICLFTDQATDLTADVVGYLPAGSDLTAVDPARLLDTRPTGETIDGDDQAGGLREPGSEYTLQIGGRGGVPAGATAAIVNVTAVLPEQKGFVTAHPCVDPRPNASSLNFVAGVNGGNEIIARLDTDGQLCLFTDQRTHLTVDVVGYLA